MSRRSSARARATSDLISLICSSKMSLHPPVNQVKTSGNPGTGSPVSLPPADDAFLPFLAISLLLAISRKPLCRGSLSSCTCENHIAGLLGDHVDRYHDE